MSADRPPGNGPACSVVVPVRDGGSALAALVEALAAQTLGRSRFEVIVADDGSREAPVHLADPPWLRVASATHAGSFAARNRGVALARADVIAFTDADCLPAEDWLARGLEALEHADFISGRMEPILPARPTVWSLVDMGTWHDLERIAARGGGVTGNMLVRRAAFERVGGFDEALPSGGDFDFVQRCLAAEMTGGLATTVVVRHPTIDRGAPLLRKTWFRYRFAAARDAREGRLPQRLNPLYWIPGMSLVRRRRAGLPIGFDPDRLADPELRARISPGRLFVAWFLRDVPLHYWATAAQLSGWLRRRAGPPK